MAKKTKALSGASQDAYFRRVLKAHPNLPAEERDGLVRQLRQEIAQLRLRTPIHKSTEEQPAPSRAPALSRLRLPPPLRRFQSRRSTRSASM